MISTSDLNSAELPQIANNPKNLPAAAKLQDHFVMYVDKDAPTLPWSRKRSSATAALPVWNQSGFSHLVTDKRFKVSILSLFSRAQGTACSGLRMKQCFLKNKNLSL